MSWRIGVSTGIDLGQPIADVLPELRAAGATGVEISTPPGHFDYQNPTTVAGVASTLVRTEIEAVSVHLPFGHGLDLASPSADERRAGLAAATAAIEAAKALGATLAVVHPSDLERHHRDVRARLAHAAEGLSALGATAADANVTLVLETPLPHLIGGHPEEFRWLLGQLPPAVGVCLDTGHTWLGHHWSAFLDVAGARLVHLHASDNHGHRDDHLPPGDGRIDWRTVADGLRAVDFSGWIILELHAGGVADRVSYLRRALDQAKRLLTTH